MQRQPATETPWWNSGRMVGARRGVSLLLLLALSALVVVSYLPDSPVRACREQVAATGTLVTVCRPLGTDDIVLVGLIVLGAGLLLWPDLSELGVGGLLTIKRQVAETKAVTDQLQGDVRALGIVQERPDLADAEADVKPPEGGAAARTGATTTGGSTGRLISPDRAALEAEALAHARLLDDVLAAAQGSGAAIQSVAVSAGVAPEEGRKVMLELRRWVYSNDRPLREWAAVRNTVRHIPERLTDEDLRSGNSLARRLLESAKQSLAAGFD